MLEIEFFLLVKVLNFLKTLFIISFHLFYFPLMLKL